MITITDFQYDYARKNGIRRETVDRRVYILGWKVDRAISKKPAKINTKWAKVDRLGIRRAAVTYRMKTKGMTMEQAIKDVQKKGGKLSEYVVYKGETVITIGTAAECAAEMGITEASLRHRTTPAYRKRCKTDKAIRVYKIEDEDE